MFTERPTIDLFLGIILFGIISVVSGYLLFRADQEAERLLRLEHTWGIKIKDEGKEFQKIRKRLVIGYRFFLITSIIMLLIIGAILYERL